ncbi:unnamed protein product [Schistosoma mattheei]|uniref:Uncharacterized protein n=1 Tax=Schistosoma mattheei TaxID=31246 RepID=A0A183NHR0_9TREM|nr:unnamed protein product [Schistosoma mattheei]
MHQDRPHDAEIKHKGKLELSIPIVDRLDNKKRVKDRDHQLEKPCIGRLPVHSRKPHIDKQEREADAF